MKSALIILAILLGLAWFARNRKANEPQLQNKAGKPATEPVTAAGGNEVQGATTVQNIGPAYNMPPIIIMGGFGGDVEGPGYYEGGATSV